MIPTENPWNSSHLEHPREPRETAEAGQRRKCHIIDLLECSKIAGCHVHRLGERARTTRGGLPPGRSVHALMPTQSRRHGTRCSPSGATQKV
jgi:hypothetical protein